MKDPFEHIHNATNERLAEMVDTHNKWRRGETDEQPFSPTELGVILDEVARRLRIPPHITFNDEYFDI